MKLRSLLYVPASEERFIAKAHTRGADAIILDLEDSVAPDAKDAARAALSASIASVGQSGATVFVRINAGPDTTRKDAKAAVLGGAFGLLVPKASGKSVSDLNAFLDNTDAKPGISQMQLIPLVEDAAALLDALELAAQPRVMALMLGGEDFATSLGATPDPDVLRPPKLMVHFSAKARGLLSFGMFRSVTDYTDTDAIVDAAREAKRFGFDGATCVHPSSVDILNTAFAPTPQEVAWATRVLAQARVSGKGAFSFEGRLVDAPVLDRARGILSHS